MTFADFTVKQLMRMYSRIQSTLYYGGPYGWDWPTLAAVFPEKYTALKNIIRELKARA